MAFAVGGGGQEQAEDVLAFALEQLVFFGDFASDLGLTVLGPVA